MKPGVYSNLSNAEYHGGPGSSKSFLDLVHRSPLHAKHSREHANDNQPTTAQAIGTAFHTLVLEPEVFVKEYCLALRQSDVPHAIADRDTLVAMAEKYNAEQMLLAADTIKTRDELVARIAELNTTRLPKLSTSGNKDDLVARIIEQIYGGDSVMANTDYELGTAKTAQLKAIIELDNESRPGLLSDKGTTAELAKTLRDAGQEFRLFSEVCEAFLAQAGHDYLVDAKGSMAEIAQGLRNHGHTITLWSEVKAVWLENNGHRNVLDSDAWEQLHRMRDAVMAHPAARALLTAVPGVAEQSVYWIDAETGELCRCRPDFWRQDGIIVDVKTCEDASPEGFAKSIHNWRYHVQHPFYQDGINAMREQLLAAAAGEEFPPVVPAPVRAFVFLAVEKKAPHAVAVYMLDAEAVELGRMEYRRDLNTLHQCIENDNWPGYGDVIQPITLPAWAFTKALAA